MQSRLFENLQDSMFLYCLAVTIHDGEAVGPIRKGASGEVSAPTGPDGFLGCGERFLTGMIGEHEGLFLPALTVSRIGFTEFKPGVIVSVPLAVVTYLFILEERELESGLMGQLEYSEAHLAERCDAIPDYGNEMPCLIEKKGRDIGGLRQGALFGVHFKILRLDEDGNP